MVRNQSDERRKRREFRVLDLLEQIRAYTLNLRLVLAGVVQHSESSSGLDACTAAVTLMKLSFDEEHRKATTQLGRQYGGCSTILRTIKIIS